MQRLAILLIGATILPYPGLVAAQEPSAGPRARALEITRSIVFTLDQLDGELRVLVKDPAVDRTLLLQTQATFGATLTLQNTLRPGVDKNLVAARYDALDRPLDQLIARISGTPARLQSLRQLGRRLRYDAEQLEQILGDHGPAPEVKVLLRQASNVESAARELDEAASAIKVAGPEDEQLRAWTSKLAQSTATFRGEVQRGVPLTVLRKEYLSVHQVWQAVARQLGDIPPRMFFLVRVRAERFAASHERLCALLSLKVQQPPLPYHPDNAEEKALEQLEGTWYLVSQRSDGRPAPADAKSHVMTISGNRWHNVLDGQVAGAGTLRIVDAASNPWKVNFQTDNDPNRMLAVIQVDAQFLRYCAHQNQPRPTDFVTRPGDGRSFSLWRRVRLD